MKPLTPETRNIRSMSRDMLVSIIITTAIAETVSIGARA